MWRPCREAIREMIPHLAKNRHFTQNAPESRRWGEQTAQSCAKACYQKLASTRPVYGVISKTVPQPPARQFSLFLPPSMVTPYKFPAPSKIKVPVGSFPSLPLPKRGRGVSVHRPFSAGVSSKAVPQPVLHS